ncbi:MAG: response regulator transcription factor [Bryobacteraceae bacterium]|nr:response regulator transcription factor [Bryobacteraceae bacterium]
MNPFTDQRITVGVCDTQPVAIEGLRSLLNRSAVYKLIEPAKHLEGLGNIMVTMSPRLVIADKSLGTADLSDFLKRMRLKTETPVVVWGASISDSEALRFLQAGAKGILRKTTGTEGVMACLDAIANGGTWMDDTLFQNAAMQRSPRTDFTAREQQVLELVEQGLRNKDIGQELGIRPGTVKIHLKHIFEKSGVRGRYSLALSGIRTRYVEQALTA